MSLSTLLGETLPNYINSLPLSRFSQGAFGSISGKEWVNLVTFLAGAYALLFVPVFIFAAILKYKPANKGLFQWSPSFYDGSIISALPYASTLAPCALTAIGLYLDGPWVWLMFLAGYVAVPIVDVIVGEDSYNPTKEQEKALKNQLFFRAWTWLYLPAQIALTTYGAYWIYAKGDDLTLFQLLAVIVNVGTAAGFGIGCVHELAHRPGWDVILCQISLCWTTYGHFYVEHLFGHHKRVASDEDPASSALGESLYAFWPRVTFGSLFSAWDIEYKYQKKNGRSLLTPYNRILPLYIASGLLTYIHYAVFGKYAAIYFLFQGFVSSLTLENVNYIEHYGLRRRKLVDDKGRVLKNPDGETMYERPGWFHAWNSGDRITNWLLFKIQRHPDHHTNAGRPYQILRTFKESPTLPTGYAGMVLLSWFPPLYKWVMDDLVSKAYADRLAFEQKGVNPFPAGANNISSAWQREGEGYFEPGSSPYDAEFYGSDATESEFTKLEKSAKAAVPSSEVESKIRAKSA